MKYIDERASGDTTRKLDVLRLTIHFSASSVIFSLDVVGSETKPMRILRDFRI